MRARGDDSGRRRARTRGLLRPLAQRDFALMWAGLAVSMLGDGIYVVAVAWQVFELHDTPAALAAVGFAWMVPQVGLLLLGGVLADRHERRRLLIAADLVRAAALAALAVLALTDALVLWHIVALVVLHGAGEALFGPAFRSIIPDLVAPGELHQANAIEGMVRPFAVRLAGPALGGALVATAGAGFAFAVDAVTFLVSAAFLAAISARPAPERRAGPALREVRAGFEYARSQPWLWATLVSASVALLCFWGPIEVLLPFLVKNELGGSAGELGLVLATGGVGAIVAAIAMGRRPLPRGHMRAMYAAWSAGCVLAIGFAVVTAPWHAMVVNFAMEACFAAGTVIWVTTLQRTVPSELLGRVSSVDWMASFALIPVSFLLVGPISHAAGVDATLVAGGALAAIGTAACLLVPGIRDPERIPAQAEEVA